ncbi:MAG: HesA/MoeB/ThiF family protein [Dehalococcoidia bacterium]|nr:HesA/MoeB/ThiF family protein [Dehalococcoidia bacterium]MBL7124908.1 HesA/MoeB/ThiF family protein [Dehalococcoidales bacterium]
MLTKDELERYDRQIMIKEVGEEGQEKLKQARIFVAGAGGLGSPVSTYLVAAGVGVIRVVDRDSVELSNLNRQVLHWDEDIGRRKVDSATEKLKKLNQEAEIEAIGETITEANISQLVAGFDLIVDAMDNLPTRYLLNKVALEKNIPFFHGAVYGFQGRAMTIIPGETACLRCVYRGVIPEEKFPVIGVTPAVIGCIQATEVIKYIVGIGQLLTNRLLVYDGLNVKFTEFRVKKDPNCEHCGQLAGDKK